jgi:hypothetical protein
MRRSTLVALYEIVQEFRYRGYAANKQIIASAGAGDIEEVPFGMRSCKGIISSWQAITTTTRNSRPSGRGFYEVLRRAVEHLTHAPKSGSQSASQASSSGRRWQKKYRWPSSGARQRIDAQ